MDLWVFTHNHWGVEDETHNGILYSLNSAGIDLNNPSDNNANAYLSDDFLSTSKFYYRNGQEVTVNTSSDVSEVGTSAWETTAGKINYEIDLTGTTLLDGNNIALHWDMTCGNDTIEGQYTVPEPAIIGLLALGLIGIGVSRRKKP